MTEKKEKKEVLSLKKLHEWIKGNQTRHEKLVKQIDKNESYNSDRRCIIRDKIDATQVAIFIAFALIVGLIVWCLCLQLDGINKINNRIYPDGNTQPLVTKCQAKKIVKQNISKPFIDDYEDFMIVLRNSITSNDKSIIIGEGGLLKNYQWQLSISVSWRCCT